MAYGLLIDTTKCVGCRGCQVACKQANDLPADPTGFRAIRTNPPDLTAHTWSLVEFYEVPKPGERVAWRFIKRQCMHCLEPACVPVCPVHGLQKTAEGPVIHPEDRCIGCHNCMVACPFDVPKYEEGATTRMRKCRMCAERLADGEQPACSKACITGAIKFGPRDALLAEAHGRIKAQPSQYASRVYGEQEVGGTAVLYLADVAFTDIGLPANLPPYAVSATTLAAVPLLPTLAARAALASFAYLLARRRRGFERNKPTTTPLAAVDADGPPADPPQDVPS